MNAVEGKSRMVMPWPVKVVWWWYLTLACASCVPLVFCLVKVDFRGYGELFGLLAGTASWAAYFSGLALAVRRGRRGWATVPYGVVGLLMIMIGWEVVLRYGLTLKYRCCPKWVRHFRQGGRCDQQGFLGGWYVRWFELYRRGLFSLTMPALVHTGVQSLSDVTLAKSVVS